MPRVLYRCRSAASGGRLGFAHEQINLAQGRQAAIRASMQSGCSYDYVRRYCSCAWIEEVAPVARFTAAAAAAFAVVLSARLGELCVRTVGYG